jgi:hypothetical protein
VVHRRLIKATAYSLIAVLVIVLIAGLAFYVRLAQGPVSLGFMTETIQNQINRNLSGMSVTIGGAVIERVGGQGVPHFRLRNLELRDETGNLIARAPRAAIAIDESAILRAAIVPTSLELIGPRIRIMRSLDGSIELGFSQAAPADEVVIVNAEADDPAAGKSDQEPVGGNAETMGNTASIIRMLSGDPGEEGSTFGSIETIRVADAAIKIYDEANDSIWDVPKADLAFRRMPYGFAVVANAEVSNGPGEGVWHADLTASYRRESRSFAVSMRVSDLILAKISDEIYALSQLARVKVPLAGQIEAEITEEGLVSRASAEFSAAAGEVGLPDYLADPIIVDEGSLRADYDPVTGAVVITDSTVLVGSSRAQITGSVVPVRDEDGRLSAVKISMQARNVAIDAQGSIKSPVAVDRIDFIGRAAIDEARLDIDDLVVMSGDTGVRLRGTITGGGESPGILMSGRIRDLSYELLRQLWPPIMAPKTRQWINEHIQAGRIVDGEFQVNLPVDALAKAQRQQHLPAKSINLGFRVAGVTTTYVTGLPPLTEATASGTLIDNDFRLEVDSADVEMPSGLTAKLNKSAMLAQDILATETMGHFALDVEASTGAIMEYLSNPVLNVIRHSGFDTSKLSGDAKVKVDLTLPLIKDVPDDRVVVKAEAAIANTALKDALPGMDLTGGDVAVTVADGVIEAKGPVKLAGIPAKLSWRREAGDNARQSATFEADLDGEQRLKLGIDLGEFVRGPVALKANIADLSDPEGKVTVEADLSEADIFITAIDYMRPATAKTHASLTFYSKGGKGRRIEDLVLKGPGILIRGQASIAAKGGIQEAKFNDVRLSDENIFAVTIKNGDAGTSLSLYGDSFDARPLLKQMFSTRTTGGAEADAKPAEPIAVSLNVDRVYAYRGEVLTGVSGSLQALGGRVQTAEISGTFLSGQPVVFRVSPVQGGREMRINGRDGGAAIRAANLYGKVAGGQIELYALLDDAGSSVRRGQLVLRNFQIRNEAALAQLDTRGKPKKAGPRKEALTFKKMTMPFTTDAKFIRIGESLVRGDELGATAEGVIRKTDGAFDITGTIIPAYGPNAALGGIPLLGDILTGGGGEGIFGVTYALGGSMDRPVFQINPVSAIAPGIFRKLFDYNNGSAPSQQRGGDSALR